MDFENRVMEVLNQLGKLGHKEIARSYSACLRLLWSAGGAGVVTAATVLLKMRIFHASVTVIGGGFWVALNFVLSFMLMQILGFRLATKQSPLIGAAMGKRWQELTTFSLGFPFFREEIGWGLRTQMVSAMGNLAFVSVAILAFGPLYHWIHGAPFLDAVAARAALHSLHPWETGSLSYAAFTGVLLWACSLIAGTRAGRYNAVFNISLGLALAFAPVYGQLTGLPVDVRHFTLSGGLTALSVSSLGFEAAWEAGLLEAVVGVFAIGFLNFSVSFALAFLSAGGNRGSWRREVVVAGVGRCR